MGKFAAIFGKRASSGTGGASASQPASQTVTETVTETEGQTVAQRETQTQYASLGNVPTVAQAVPAAGHKFGTYDGQLHPVTAATVARLTGSKQKQGES